MMYSHIWLFTDLKQVWEYETEGLIMKPSIFPEECFLTFSSYYVPTL